jgi:hypothetical protein
MIWSRAGHVQLVVCPNDSGAEGLAGANDRLGVARERVIFVVHAQDCV